MQSTLRIALAHDVGTQTPLQETKNHFPELVAFFFVVAFLGGFFFTLLYKNAQI